MYHNSIPPYSIIPPKEGNKNYIVVNIHQGYHFFEEKMAEFPTFNEAKEYIKELLKDGSTYSFWKEELGYEGTEKEFLEFCCR